MNYIGIDIGGTNLKAGLVDEDGRLLAVKTMKIREVSDPDALTDTLVALTRELAQEGGVPMEEIASVGAGVPGVVDIRTGSIVYTCNLPLRNIPLRKLFKRRLGLHLYVENDANCAALAENLLESELFGHERGAFTGADRRREGRFLQADGGTLFLDEIGEMPLSLQAKLLRALQQGEVQRVGSDSPITVDVRVIAATNRNLREEVEQKRFREDLFFRLNVISIEVPALRERSEDIPLLAAHFLEKFAARNRKNVKGFAPQALDMLRRYSWPGNVRELHNFLDRYTAFGDVALESLGDAGKTELLFPALHHEGLTLETATLQLEERLIRQALERCRWRRGDAAEALGLNLRTLQRKMKRLGMGR